MKTPRMVNGIDGQRLAPASINRTLGILRHMLNWAVGREYLDRTPFRRGTEVLVRMELEDNKRRRRISEQEEAALLAVASPYLRSMIIAALDTGMRRGEMVAMRFGDIDWQTRRIVLRGARWRKGSYKDLDAASLQRLREIDLHWHAIRHEYASRLVEKGVPLAHVRDLLGHASILTTERYDNQKMEALQAAVERLETGRTFDPPSAQPDPSAEARSSAGAKAGPAAPKRPSLQGAKAEVSGFFQDQARQPSNGGQAPPTEAS